MPLIDHSHGLRPESSAELAGLVAMHHDRGQKIPPLDLTRIGRVLELAPEDMTVSVEAGITLATLQNELERHGQWLPVDPPGAANLTIHELLAWSLSGPRRYGFGAIREHVIGMKVVLADGRIIKSGGKVVKNVAGYDLMKLFIGAGDSLGVICEVTFKVRPRPQMEQLVEVRVNDLAAVRDTIRAVLDSPVSPVVLDVFREDGSLPSPLCIVLGFAGMAEEVEWQLGEVRRFGFVTTSSLDHEIRFWSATGPVHKKSVRPSNVCEEIARLNDRPFIARAGNGIFFYRGEALPSEAARPTVLMRRLKAVYDPKGILPELLL